MDRSVDAVIIGMGYVGLPLAREASAAGLRVIGFDVNAEVVDGLNHGRSHVDDLIDSDVVEMLGRGFFATTDASQLRRARTIVVCVPTPLSGDGTPDLGPVRAAATSVAEHLHPNTLVILESTTYPGTTDEEIRPILEAGGLVAGEDFSLVFSPERIDPGNREWNFVNTAKVVSGVGADSLSVVEAFYGALVEKVVPVASTAEAELVKLLENTFRHVNIALVNELAMFARDLDVDIWSAIDAAASKPYGFMRFTPGPGVGGHCLPVDPEYLAWRVEQRIGQRFRFVELANAVNRGMPSYVVARVMSMLNDQCRSVKGARILLIGLAYKAGTSDWRGSPSMLIAERLLELGADLRAHDPLVSERPSLGPAITRVSCSVEEIAAADLVVLCVDHAELPYNDIVDHARLVLDTRGRLRGLGFRGELL